LLPSIRNCKRRVDGNRNRVDVEVIVESTATEVIVKSTATKFVEVIVESAATKFVEVIGIKLWEGTGREETGGRIEKEVRKDEDVALQMKKYEMEK